jgi:hypothetical protein
MDLTIQRGMKLLLRDYNGAEVNAFEGVVA